MITRWTLAQELQYARRERDLEMWDREYPDWEARSADDYETRFVTEGEMISPADIDTAGDDDFEYAYGAFMESVYDPD